MTRTLCGSAQTAQMPVEIPGGAVAGPERLKDAVAQEKASIEHREYGGRLVEQLAVQRDDGKHMGVSLIRELYRPVCRP